MKTIDDIFNRFPFGLCDNVTRVVEEVGRSAKAKPVGIIFARPFPFKLVNTTLSTMLPPFKSARITFVWV